MTPEQLEKDKRELAEAKKALPAGPWQQEPDRVDFEHAGLPCFLHRNRLGAWCGYAGVPEGHALFGVHYDSDKVKVEVHGGLTYSGECEGVLCHVGEGKRWWFGFDCSHAWDVTPGLRFQSIVAGEIYRDAAYAEAQTRRLAEQLAAA